MKTQFTYNINRTFNLRHSAIKRRLFWQHFIGWIVLSVGFYLLGKLFWGWI